MKRRAEQVAFSFPTVDLLDCIERISDVTVILIEAHIMIYSYIIYIHVVNICICIMHSNALWYNHTFPNTILIANRGLPEKHFVEAFVTQLLSNDFELEAWLKNWRFSTFSQTPPCPPGPWQLTLPRMDLAFHRLEALRLPEKPTAEMSPSEMSPCSSCSLAQSSWTLSVSSSWKPEVEEA